MLLLLGMHSREVRVRKTRACSHLLRRQPKLHRQLREEVGRLVASLQELVEVLLDVVVRQRRDVVAQDPRGQGDLRQEVHLEREKEKKKKAKRGRGGSGSVPQESAFGVRNSCA